ncbi:MAG: methyltransferase domain-containing protein [Acidimicrobiales bacterium]
MTDLGNPAQAWSAVAQAWDTHTDYTDDHTVEATTAMLDALAVQPGERVLEVAAGPGTLGATWSGLVGPTGAVVLSDVAPGMVDVARRRNAGLGNVDTAVVDVAATGYPDGSFDVVACRMGLMFTLDPAAAFAELFRILRPGGRLGSLTWGSLERNPWMTCVGMAAMIHGLAAGGPPVGPGGIFSLSDPAALERLAKSAGFVDVSVKGFAISFRADSIDAHVERVGSLAGPLASVLQAASPDQLAALRATAAELAAPYVTESGVDIPGAAVLLSARRDR